MMYAIGPSETTALSREFLFWCKKELTPSKAPQYAIDAFVLPAHMAYDELYDSVTPVNARLLLE